MTKEAPFKIKSYTELFTLLPENERVIVDVLRSIIIHALPHYCKEKMSFNVPFFYGNKGICIVWPATIPRGGIKTGVLLGFWRGNQLNDKYAYLKKGTNKKVFYKIMHSMDDVNVPAIESLLKEAVKLDGLKK
jgi:Domain of unknown function (DU1801)